MSSDNKLVTRKYQSFTERDNEEFDFMDFYWIICWYAFHFYNFILYVDKHKQKFQFDAILALYSGGGIFSYT